MPILGDLTPERFLREYWQKKPLLLRGAFPEAASVITPEALKALATREDAVSRLVLAEGGAYPWELQHGPFQKRALQKLPARGWALLVQEVDRFVPAARALLEPLRFIPRWRIDDVMVSLAPPESGVGAHVDSYDVFLLQGLGRRRWRIGSTPVVEEHLVPDLDVAILEDFVWTDEYVLAPGDMLYLPPRIAHEGVALDECLTISLGFRAPSHAEIVAGFLEYALRALPDDRYYTDPDLSPTDHPGEIAPEALDQVREVLRAALDDEQGLREWFGSFMTESRRGFDAEGLDEEVPPERIAGMIRSGTALTHAPDTRFAYVHHPETDEATLFAGGQAFRLEPALRFAAPLLADETHLGAERLAPHLGTPDFADLLATLVTEGFLIADETSA